MKKVALIIAATLLFNSPTFAHKGEDGVRGCHMPEGEKRHCHGKKDKAIDAGVIAGVTVGLLILWGIYEIHDEEVFLVPTLTHDGNAGIALNYALSPNQLLTFTTYNEHQSGEPALAVRWRVSFDLF